MRFLFTLPVFLLLAAPLAQAQNGPAAPRRITVREALDIASRANLTLLQRENQLQISQVNAEQAKLAYIPSVNGVADFQRQFGTSFDYLSFQRVNRATSYSSPALRLTYDLFAGLSKFYYLKQTRSTLMADQFGYGGARDNLMTQVLSQFLLLQLDETDIATSTDRIALMQKELEMTRIRYQGGIATELMVLNLEGQIALERTNLIDAQNRRARDQLTLEQLLQLEPGQAYEFVAPDTLPAAQMLTPLPDPLTVAEYALENLPIMREAEMRIEAARFQAKVSRASRMPRLTFTGALASNYTSNGGQATYTSVPMGVYINGTFVPFQDASGQPLQQSVRTGVTRTAYFQQLKDNSQRSVAFQLSIPIFNGGLYRRNQQVAVLQAANAELNLEATRNTVYKQVYQAYLDAESAQSRFMALRTQLQAFSRAFELTQAQFKAGTLTFYDYMQALNNRSNAQLQVRQASYDLLFKRKILDYYGGKPVDF